MIVDDDRYEVFDDPYCYRGTQVLKNKAKLRAERVNDSETAGLIV